MTKALILLSGGQDSTTCLYWAKQKFDEVYAIGFDYGQKHKIEVEKAKKIAENAGVSFKVVKIDHLFTAHSSLVDHSDHNERNQYNNNLPASFVSGRNLIFLTIAAEYASSIGANDIVTGTCQTDFNDYPDCRRNTIDALQLSLSLGLGMGDIRIHTPLMYLTKAETWKLSKELDCIDVIINDTLTDYNGSQVKNEWGFGELNNTASILRAEGYSEAKSKGWV